MAKIGVNYRNVKRQNMVNRDAEKRAELKKMIIDPSLSFEERMDARDKLNKLPIDGAKVRLKSRCVMTGRPRGVYRKFKICRNEFRRLASEGALPGVTKASW